MSWGDRGWHGMLCSAVCCVWRCCGQRLILAVVMVGLVLVVGAAGKDRGLSVTSISAELVLLPLLLRFVCA